MDGSGLLKLSRSSLRSDYGGHFVDGSERREIWAELTALKMQLIEGFERSKKGNASSPTLFAPKALSLRNRPSVIRRRELRAERRTKSKELGPRHGAKSSYKGTTLPVDGGDDGDDGNGYCFRSDGFLTERVGPYSVFSFFYLFFLFFSFSSFFAVSGSSDGEMGAFPETEGVESRRG